MPTTCQLEQPHEHAGSRLRLHHGRADGGYLLPGHVQRHPGVQRRGVVHPGVRLSAGPAHPRPRVWCGGPAQSPSTPTPTRSAIPPLSDSLWGGASMLSNSPFDFWTYAQGRPLQHLRFPRGADGRLRQREQHRDRPLRRPQGASPRRWRHGRPWGHDPPHLPVVVYPRPPHLRRPTPLPLRHRVGRRRRPPRAHGHARRTPAVHHQPVCFRLRAGQQADAAGVAAPRASPRNRSRRPPGSKC